MITSVICTKTLVNDEGQESFTKGERYFLETITDKLKETTITTDNQGGCHQLGNWLKHFKST